jgi:predicted flap endonuclease-1-like 5' DNA nuclease
MVGDIVACEGTGGIGVMLTVAEQYWPVLAVVLVIIIAVVLWLRRSTHVAIDTEQSIRPTLSREVAPVVAEPEVKPPFFRIEPMEGTPDNLLEIKGLGPRIAMMLNGLGVTRFEQIARLTPDEQTQLDHHLGPFKGRIDQDRWIDQARILASGDRAAFEAEFGKINGGPA